MGPVESVKCLTVDFSWLHYKFKITYERQECSNIMKFASNNFRVHCEYIIFNFTANIYLFKANNRVTVGKVLKYIQSYQ